MSVETSVILPVRNGARFVAEAVGSALAQLASHDEVLVVDDASTDNTRIALSYIRDARFRILEGSGRGVSSARNIGLAAASGEFIAFLDHDDLWPPSRHAALLQALHDNPEADCAVGRIRLRMEDDAVILPQLAQMDGCLRPNLSLCTALFRRRIISRVGTFDEDMRFSEDTDFIVRLNECGFRPILCNIDALTYRRHATNATCNRLGQQNGFFELIRRRRARIAGATSRGR